MSDQVAVKARERTVKRASLWCVIAAASVACIRGPRAAADVPSAPLLGRDGAVVDARALSRAAPATVFIFYSRHCHCLEAHDGRIRGLFGVYAPRGVRFVMVDSEAAGDATTDANDAERRGYRFPILVDRGGKLADDLGAEYATYTVVTDAGGRVVYAGGLDSDRRTLHEDAVFYVRDALDDVLAARTVRVQSGKTLGCALER